MKNHHAVKVLFFINLLYLHCLPNYCDIKQDASIPSESTQADKVISADSSGAGNVPSKQNEIEKDNLVLENSPKEFVQSNVEYVNNDEREKDKEVIVERIGRIEPLHVSAEIQQNEASLQSSRSVNPPDSVSDDKPAVNKKQIETISHDVTSDKSTETEPLSPELIPKSHSKESTIEKISKPSKSVAPETVTPSKYPDVKPSTQNNIHYASASESQNLEDGVHQQYDGMPSFDEWKKMMLAEQEKGGRKVPSPATPGKKISSQKRRRNYSSYECGAKIVAANGEAEGTSRILNEMVDEYMLNPCKTKIWFVIELCETVQASQIELANFELFSSCPKDFAVYSSDIFPTRDWVPLGTFTAAELRGLQSFELKQEGFGKFIKIELLSHYGEEHYCPLSVVRIFGTSMVDEYEEMETLSAHRDIPDDDLDRLDIPAEDQKPSNIFGSATDAVMNIVKKAAQALSQQSVDEKKNETAKDSLNASESKTCSVVDSSSNKCKNLPLKSKDVLAPLNSFALSPTSMHQSLFRLLHSCDQCVSSRIRYYSSAQPHCRFFQAALGPVVFQTLCDWFKEHPLAIAHESPAPHKKDIPDGSFIISPTKSPPPQIIRIPSESDLSLKSLFNDSLKSVKELDESVTINMTSLLQRANKTASLQEKITLQSSIKPTQTLTSGQSSLFNDSIETSSKDEETVVPSASSVSEELTKISVLIPDKTEDSISESMSETASSGGGDLVTSNDVLSESEQQQINEFLSDSKSVMPEDMPIEVVPATELPSVSKPGEKVVDMRSENQGKLEPVVPAGSTTAGQKESVFMRMSNRIKALEINMSLSSQYLQELSQRYRRQMEEMQRAFNRTIGTLNDTARKAAEKDLKQQEVINSLQLQVANLSEIVEFLLTERASMLRQMIETHICLMIIEAIIMITIMSLCIRRISATKPSPSVNRSPILSPARLSKRRNSADSCSPPVARKLKKRSNSEENLTAEDLLIVEPLPVLLDPILRIKKKNRKRNKGIHRSISHPTVQSNNPTSLENRRIHSEGSMSSNTKPKPQPNKSSHACENCDNNICTSAKHPSKERRSNCSPLQNLTNGSVISSAAEKNGRKFSFKKFLKFQKRDSI